MNCLHDSNITSAAQMKLALILPRGEDSFYPALIPVCFQTQTDVRVRMHVNVRKGEEHLRGASAHGAAVILRGSTDAGQIRIERVIKGARSHRPVVRLMRNPGGGDVEDMSV